MRKIRKKIVWPFWDYGRTRLIVVVQDRNQMTCNNNKWTWDSRRNLTVDSLHELVADRPQKRSLKFQFAPYAVL